MRTGSVVCIALLSASAAACSVAPADAPADEAHEALVIRQEPAPVQVELPSITTVNGDDGVHVQVKLPSKWRNQNPFGGIAPNNWYGTAPFPGWVCTLELLVYPPRCGAWGPPGPALTPPFPGWVCEVLLLSDPPQCGKWGPPPPALVPPIPGMVCTMYLLSDPPKCGRWEFPENRPFDLEILIEILKNRPVVRAVNDGFEIGLDDQVIPIVPNTVAAVAGGVVIAVDQAAH